MITSPQVFAGTSAIASHLPATDHGQKQDFRGDNPQSGSRYEQQDRAGIDLEYADDHRRAQPSRASSTTARAEASIRGLSRHIDGSERSYGAYRRSSYMIPPHPRAKRLSPNPLTPSSPHLCHCDRRYRANIREIYREGCILQQKMERLLVGSSRLTPNEDEIDWEADKTTPSMLFRPCYGTQDEADKKLWAYEDTGSRITGVDVAKIDMSGPHSRNIYSTSPSFLSNPCASSLVTSPNV